MEFAQRLRELMEKEDITAYRLSKILNVHQTTIKNWLDGSSKPRTEYMEKLAVFFGVSLDYLTGYSNESNTSNALKPGYSSVGIGSEKEKQVNLLNKLISHNSDITFGILSALCRNERIDKDITERGLSKKAGIPLNNYLKFELKNGELTPDEIIQVLNALDINSTYAFSYIEGCILRTIKDKQESRDFIETNNDIVDDYLLNEITQQILELSPEGLALILDILKCQTSGNVVDKFADEKLNLAYNNYLNDKKSPQQKPEADS